MYFLAVFRLGVGGGAVLAFLSACAVTTTLVLLTIRICRKHGWVSKPHADRWHKGTPAFFGGVPIFAGFAALSIAFIPWSNHLLWRLLAIASLVFVLGLIDDTYHLKPAPKLAGQLLAAGLLAYIGVICPLSGSIVLNAVVAVLWLVGITNAFNLLDNMDGLSAGIALISAGFLTVFLAIDGYRDQAVLVALLAGSIAGFLIFNFNPARIFMGDSGSLFIGFMLGATSILGATHVAGTMTPASLAVPVTLLAIPIFDTLFVSVTRRLRGQPISQGGTDHSSHRLVRMGLHERSAVWLLYALSAVSGAMALLTRESSSDGTFALLASFWFFILLFGVHLFQDEVKQNAIASNAAKLLATRLLSRDKLVFLLDPLAIAVSYCLAYSLPFGASIPPPDRALLLRFLPIAVAIKVLSLWLCQAFRHSWWRGSISDLYRLGLATLIGESTFVFTLTELFRFDVFSRTAFFFDALVTLTLLLLVRRSFALFQDTIYTCRVVPSAQRRVFILGTSAHAELALRFLRNQSIECAGFIDTNGGADLHRYVFGRPVLGRVDDLGWLSQRHGIFEVVLPDCERILLPDVDFQSFCRRRQLRITKLGFHNDEKDEKPRLRAASG